MIEKKFLSLLIFILINKAENLKYSPDWSSLDTRPLPKWYDDAKVGIFIHWGVFSVPSFRSEWFWWDWQGDKPTSDVVDFMKKNYPPNFEYADFAPEFKAEFFDPLQWVSLLNASGAKYVVLTSKHHEGYTLWPSAYSWNWNSNDVGPHRDLVGDLAQAIRTNSSLRFGLYHSLFEWFNPLYLSDKNQSFKTQTYVKEKALPSLYEIVNKYEPEVVWSDGDWEAHDSYWNSTAFIAWLYNESPVKDSVVVNDRWGSGVLCQHGDFYTCQDNFNPGKLLNHKWENCMPLDNNSWGYRRNLKLSDILTIEEVIKSLAETVSCGGNILINIGPTKEGTVAPIFEERLRQLGEWLSINGEAIYESKPWKYQNDTKNPDVWYTTNGDLVYAILLKYPQSSLKVELGSVQITEATQINILGNDEKLQWVESPEGGVVIDLHSVDASSLISKWAWTFKLENISYQKC